MKKRTWAIEVTDKDGPLIYLVRLSDAEGGKVTDFRAAPAEKVGMNVKSFRRQVLGC